MIQSTPQDVDLSKLSMDFKDFWLIKLYHTNDLIRSRKEAQYRAILRKYKITEHIARKIAEYEA